MMMMSSSGGVIPEQDGEGTFFRWVDQDILF